MWSTPSLPLLPGPLGLGVVVRVSVRSMWQKELLNNFLYLKSFHCVQTNELCYIELLVLNSNT